MIELLNRGLKAAATFTQSLRDSNFKVALRSLRSAFHSLLRPTQPSNAPEEKAEEDQSATVHPERVADLVGAPGILRGVDSDIMAENKIGQRDGHERTLHHPTQKPRRPGTLLEVCLGAVERPANGAAQRDEKDHALQHRP